MVLDKRKVIAYRIGGNVIASDAEGFEKAIDEIRKETLEKIEDALKKYGGFKCTSAIDSYKFEYATLIYGIKDKTTFYDFFIDKTTADEIHYNEYDYEDAKDIAKGIAKEIWKEKHEKLE